MARRGQRSYYSEKPMRDLWKRAGYPNRASFERQRKYPDQRPPRKRQ